MRNAINTFCNVISYRVSDVFESLMMNTFNSISIDTKLSNISNQLSPHVPNELPKLSLSFVCCNSG